MEKLQDLRNNPYWQLLIFFLAAWVAVELPLTYVGPPVEVASWQLWVDGLISVVFTLDLIFHFKCQGRPSLVFLNKKRESKNRRTFWALLDIASCIPFELIFWSLGISARGHVLGTLELIRLIRIFKVYAVFSSVEVLPRTVKLVSILTSICIVIHWVSCAWIGIGDTIVDNVDFSTQYNMAIYWTVTTLTTIGYGYITPTTNVGRLFTIMVMFLGVGVYGLVIGNISKITLSSFRHKERMREKIQDLSLLMRHYSVPKKVQREVFSYYHHLSQQRLTDNDHRILSELPHNLKQEMETYMVLNLISSIPLFEGLSSFELKRVAQCLEQEFYSPGEMIISKGDIGEQMFIISNGSVDILNEKKEAINILRSGQFFGEIALMMDVERGANVQASSYCDIYSLSKDSFVELTGRYPVLKRNISRLTIKRKTCQKAS